MSTPTWDGHEQCPRDLWLPRLPVVDKSLPHGSVPPQTCPSPISPCEGCGVPDTQGHMLLACPHWALQVTSGMAVVRVHHRHKNKSENPPPRLGLPGWYLWGQIMARLVLSGYATSLFNERSVLVCIQ